MYGGAIVRAIFRRLIGQNRVGERLHADIIADIYKRVARRVGMAAKQWRERPRSREGIQSSKTWSV
jgi:hypothetical protein